MRVLATCVMAEPRALYGMCSKADTYAARETYMDLSMAVYVSAFEHIQYSERGSAMRHVASTCVHTTPRACARGEHQHASGIEVNKKTSRFYPHTRILSNMAWSRLY